MGGEIETKRETGVCKMRVTNAKAREDGFFIASGKFDSKEGQGRGYCSEYCMGKQGLFGRMSTASSSDRFLLPGAWYPEERDCC